MTAAQKRFQKADLAERVRFAMPIARERMLLGLAESTYGVESENDLDDVVTDLVGHDGMPAGHMTDETFTLHNESLAGAYALGIATGLMLRPDAFDEKSGAK